MQCDRPGALLHELHITFLDLLALTFHFRVNSWSQYLELSASGIISIYFQIGASGRKGIVLQVRLEATEVELVACD